MWIRFKLIEGNSQLIETINLYVTNINNATEIAEAFNYRFID